MFSALRISLVGVFCFFFIMPCVAITKVSVPLDLSQKANNLYALPLCNVRNSQIDSFSFLNSSSSCLNNKNNHISEKTDFRNSFICNVYLKISISIRLISKFVFLRSHKELILNVWNDNNTLHTPGCETRLASRIRYIEISLCV